MDRRTRRRRMMLTLTIAALLIFGLILGRRLVRRSFRQDVHALFSNVSDTAGLQRFSYRSLEGLPAPVQRYFRRVLRDGQAYIRCARLKHTGFFKTGKDKSWSAIQGEQYFTTGTPGFVWQGKTATFTARDQYLNSKGRLRVWLGGMLRIADGSGEAYNQGELLRWLGESIWFPTNLLPSPALEWAAIDDSSALLRYKSDELGVQYKVHFGQDNTISELETERYYGGGSLEKWIGRVADYKEVEGVLVPMYIEASWALKDGTFSYARFHVAELQYNRPAAY